MKREISDWKEESERFDQAADVYDKYRPSYPKEIIDSIIGNSGIDAESRILEIGAGSGKATELFVERGFNVTCIEPGENLARIGTEKFSETGLVNYKVTRLEEWEDIEPCYDLAISAQAFHWVPRPLGFKRLSQSLKKDGCMGLFWNMYVNEGGALNDRLSEICRDYSIMFFQDKQGLEKMKLDWIKEIEDSGYFESPEVIEIPWKIESTYEEFMKFLHTSNGYIGLEQKLRRDFEDGVKTIFTEAGGTMIRSFNCTLYLARKLK